MSSHFDRVVWLEGMFLSPQHFQQQERYLERYSRQLFSIRHQGSAGFLTLRIDHEQLKAGKIYLREASGVFQDGTPFSIQEDLCRSIEGVEPGTLIYLALPLSRQGAVDIQLKEKASRAVRKVSYQKTVMDSNDDGNDPVDMLLAELNPGVFHEGESLDHYTFLAIARIHEIRTDGELVLDPTFIPQCLDYKVSGYLEEQVQSLHALVRQRAAMLAGQVGVEGAQKSFHTLQIVYMWLQSLNRYAAGLKLLNEEKNVSSSDLYRYLVIMAADLSTFTKSLAPEFPAFDERAVYQSFAPLLANLMMNLRHASREKVFTIEWDYRLFERRRLLRARVEDRTLFNDSRFVLAVVSSLGKDRTREVFPIASKLCGHRRIAERVRSALPGVKVQPISPPIELKPKGNVAYFEVDASDGLWQEMVKTQDLLALHIDEQMPDDTQVDCFVIR